MAMVVNHNIPALTTYNTVNRTNSALEKSIQKLSTGLRINSAADDAAGLAISEKMRSQVNGMDRAVSNAQDGISMIQTAEGALNETHSILQRMRELAVQAANDTLTSQDRSYIQMEIDELRDEVTRIGNTTQFNKKKLLNGDAAVLWSSDNLETKAVINGGLRTIDQFGQKSSAEGNYRIKVKATAGQGEVQKTDIMRIKHDVSPWYADIDSTQGVQASQYQKSPDIKGGGVYSIKSNYPTGDVNAVATQVSKVGTKSFDTVTPDTDLAKNANLKFTVTDVKTTAGAEEVTVKISGQVIGKDGKVEELADVTHTFKATDANTQSKDVVLYADDTGTDKKVTVGWTDVAQAAKRSRVGDEMVYNVTAQAKKNDGDIFMTVQGTPEYGAMKDHKYVLNKNEVNDTSLEFKVSYVESDPNNPDLKELQEGSVYLKTNKNFADNVGDDKTVATYYKNVELPDDEDDHWMKTLHTTIGGASLSKPLADLQSATYAVNADRAATAQTGSYSKVLESSRKDYIADGNIKFSTEAADTDAIDASGILVLEVDTPTENATAANREVTFKATFYGTKTDGKSTGVDGATAATSISLKQAQATAGSGAAITVTDGEGTSYNLGKLELGNINDLNAGAGVFKAGDKIYVQVTAAQAVGDVKMTVSGSNGDGNTLFSGYSPTYVIKNANVKGTDPYTLDGLAFNKDGGSVAFATALGSEDKMGSITLTPSTLAANDGDKEMDGKTIAAFKWGADNPEKIKSSIGDLANSKSSLYDIEKFWDSQGVFMLKEPQTITLTQGDGKQASITLYETDTIGSMVDKLNNAIANDLGQGKYVDDASKFVTFVDKGTEDDTSESVTGTILVRSVVPGNNGTIRFSGNEDVINALSLNTLQSAKESSYTVNIEDAHTGKKVVTDAKVTGNKLVGALHPNVDVMFDSTAGITAKWNNETKAYDMVSDPNGYETYLHLTDNTTVFQIGANEGEDMGVNIGDMRAEALGLNRVLVTDRESASHSITLIDNAIDKVSTQRAKLGAYQNRLEHTINNLNTASENITAAESRIRDTDMAKEMMNFTKLQIMLQAGTSMLAQANQLPQNVMALVR